MKRIHLFEFEDQPWFPGWLRICMTRYIQAFHRMLGTGKTLSKLVEEGLRLSKQKSVLDLCSGSGGPMVEVVEILQRDHDFSDLQLTLSDLFPDFKAAEELKKNQTVTYCLQPVDATQVDREIMGLRTMICSFHHMRPPIALKILKDAQEARQPILIYEISDNSAPIFLWWVAIPVAFLMVFFVTPMVRPMTWKQLVFTYLIPILPLLIAWDGAVSNARTYTLSDLKELISNIRSETYSWKKGHIKGKGGNKLFLMGFPNT